MQLDDIINGVIEQWDQPSDSDDGQWLRRHGTEDHRGQGGRKERFVDAIESTCVMVHIQLESQRRQQTIENG